MAKRIEENVPTVDVFRPKSLAKKDVELGQELFGPIMTVLIMLAYIIGMLVIGLIIYSDVSQRRRNFAVMKALGFKLSQIARGIIWQSLILVFLAFPIGVLLAYLTGKGIEQNMPVYLIEIMDPDGLLKVLSGVLFMMVLGSLLPLRMIRRTDPVIAFQAE